MKDFIRKLQLLEGFDWYQGASENKITQAEQSLGVTFAKDYRDMVAQFGIVSFDGHELTGICPFPRLNVVDVTREERGYHPDVPENLYVIEQAHIDGIVIWQSETGEVFQSMPNAPVMKIADSLLEYCEIL